VTTTRALDPDVRRLFEAVVELAPSERAAELARHPAHVAARVAELLAAAAAAPAFLDAPAAASDLAGHRAGPWILAERLASGGSGEVWSARRADGYPGWRLAVKVLRAHAGPELAPYMEAERRAHAALAHPYIVPLVDAGVLADGRPYLATPLVEGEPLDRACAGLGLDALLRLFVAVCAAVQHAHERLVAHCDLKPANVLVTRDGMPQLLDFGVARLIGRDAEGGVRALTPGYASPEQLAGEPLGVASDVWSLGVVLHELATGRRPFAGAPDVPAGPMSRAVGSTALPVACTPPAEAPRRLVRRLCGDLDAIVARALELDPGVRTTSVAALAADVEGFLAHRPIAARAQTAWRRATLSVRRNRAASAAAVAIVLAAGVAVGALRRDLARSEREASAGWRAHAQAALAARLIEDVARAAQGDGGLAVALTDAAATLERDPELGPEAEGRLRIALGALFLEAGRSAEARAQLERARALVAVTRGFGRQDSERIAALLAECGG
jgi:serine/threonine-protein kinase